MCDGIHLKSGIEIRSVKEFEAHFKIDADTLGYNDNFLIHRDCCLCQIDLDKFFKDKTDQFECDFGEWVEK